MLINFNVHTKKGKYSVQIDQQFNVECQYHFRKKLLRPDMTVGEMHLKSNVIKSSLTCHPRRKSEKKVARYTIVIKKMETENLRQDL